MIYILISILCSVAVGVLFKLSKRYKINIPQAITWNYLTAIILSIYCFKIDLRSIDVPSSHLYLYLGILLPVIFAIMYRSIKAVGIARSDIAQRLSLFIPVVASYFIFNEHFNSIKILSLLLGFIAIFLILNKKAKQQEISSLIYPVLVFVGYGIVDILFKKVAQLSGISYPNSLLIVFILAFILSLSAIVYQRFVKNEKIQLVNFLCGCILGLFNFANIFFYLKAHKALANTPSTVFASMNIGVIIIGTGIGVIIFREKLSRLNMIGIVTALLAIIVITLSQFYGVGG